MNNYGLIYEVNKFQDSLLKEIGLKSKDDLSELSQNEKNNLYNRLRWKYSEYKEGANISHMEQDYEDYGYTNGVVDLKKAVEDAIMASMPFSISCGEDCEELSYNGEADI